MFDRTVIEQIQAAETARIDEVMRQASPAAVLRRLERDPYGVFETRDGRRYARVLSGAPAHLRLLHTGTRDECRAWRRENVGPREERAYVEYVSGARSLVCP